MPLPLLGSTQLPEFSAREAGSMWKESVLLPPEVDLDEDAPTRIRRSPDGSWIIRMMDAKGHSAAFLGEIARREYNRLASLGLKVVAFANTPSVSDKRLFTISPWVDGLQPCPAQAYETLIAPVIENYGRTAARQEGVISTSEIGHPYQFSAHPSVSEPILHDVDPYVDGITSSIHY